MAHITEHHLFFMAADFDHTQHKTSGAEYTNGYILYFTATGFDIHCKASVSPLNNNCIPWQHHTRPLVWLGNTLLLLNAPFCVSSKRWLKCNGTVYKPSKTRTNKAELTEQSPALEVVECVFPQPWLQTESTILRVKEKEKVTPASELPLNKH